MARYYILRNDAAVEEPDFTKWLEWHQTTYEDVRCIARTEVKFGSVITTFLGMNMRPSESDPPWLFDTRVLGGWLDHQWQRSSTREEALAVHEQMVDRVKKMEREHDLPPDDCAVW